jgi:hypothetical protein
MSRPLLQSDEDRLSVLSFFESLCCERLDGPDIGQRLHRVTIRCR